METSAGRTAKAWLTPTEAAGLLMVSPVTVRAWAARGELPAEVTAGGHRRFLLTDLQKFAARRGLRLLEPANPLPASGPLRVLVVDDDRPFADYLHEFLGLQGATVEVAYDGFAAGRLVERFRPDVVLLDLRMPGLDGFAVCRVLKGAEATRHIRVVAMTGYPSDDYRARIADAGADACLAKPLDTASLLSQLGLSAEVRVAG